MNKIAFQRIAMIAFSSLFMLVGCTVMDGRSSDGWTEVQGVRLKHENTVKLSQSYPHSSLEIEGGTMSIELKGQLSPSLDLTVTYMEYEPGDATIYVDDNEISTRSKSGKPVAITSVTGRIPEHLNLEIDLGTGDAFLTNLNNAKHIEIETGTGAVKISNSRIQKLDVDTGTGRVSLQGSTIEHAVVKTGTGDIVLSQSQITKRDFHTGTGKVHDDATED